MAGIGNQIQWVGVRPTDPAMDIPVSVVHRGKLLADGQLPSTLEDLYTVPAGYTTTVVTMTFVNTSTATVTMDIYVLKAAGTARRIIPKSLGLGIGYAMIFDDAICLGAGDKIQGVASAALAVDYTIHGVEQPV